MEKNDPSSWEQSAEEIKALQREAARRGQPIEALHQNEVQLAGGWKEERGLFSPMWYGALRENTPLEMIRWTCAEIDHEPHQTTVEAKQCAFEEMERRGLEPR